MNTHTPMTHNIMSCHFHAIYTTSLPPAARVYTFVDASLPPSSWRVKVWSDNLITTRLKVEEPGERIKRGQGGSRNRTTSRYLYVHNVYLSPNEPTHNTLNELREATRTAK